MSGGLVTTSIGSIVPAASGGGGGGAGSVGTGITGGGSSALTSAELTLPVSDSVQQDHVQTDRYLLSEEQAGQIISSSNSTLITRMDQLSRSVQENSFLQFCTSYKHMK